MKPITGLALVSLLTLCSGRSWADDWWAYQYKEFDVVAAGSQRYAINLARNLDALDQSLTTIVNLDKEAPRPPIHIYALPRQIYSKFISDTNSRAFFPVNLDGEQMIVMLNSGVEDRAYYGASVGFADALIASQGRVRLPMWYRLGSAEVFGASTFKGEALSTGEFRIDHVSQLLRGPMYPMRKLLQLPNTDAEFNKSAGARFRYDAQCWFFMHQVLFERQYYDEVRDYVERLIKGEDEPSAFAASFKSVSYEDLDKFMAKAIKSTVLRGLKVTMLDISGQVRPEKLTDIQVKVRVAELAAWIKPEYARILLQEALAAEPDNERAMLASAEAYRAAGNFAELQTVTDALAARRDLSEKAIARIAFCYSILAYDPRAGENGWMSNRLNLVQRAQAYYRRAMAQDPDNVFALATYAKLLLLDRDLDATRELLPALEQAFYRAPREATLARSLYLLQDLAGNDKDAFRFAIAWERLARSEPERQEAAAHVSAGREKLAASR